MYLKSVSMQGFKSFAKKINIDLTAPVTGVVGPNGSGKSNVAEAIRFVLGEQSMKGLRSKSGSDLIFKGSSKLSPLSRASVSMYLDNSSKKIDEKIINSNTESSSALSNFITLDEIILTREIYSDGTSEYLINDTKVRLKDVQELLAMANISAAGHTIVNQGEADRILLSNNFERREMIEDALGLRIYQMRIKEGERKLEKVKIHLNQIAGMRRENLPHLNYLKKQVKELEKREEEIGFIDEMLKVYLYKENIEIERKKKEIPQNGVGGQIDALETELHTLVDAKRETERRLSEEQNDNENLNLVSNELKHIEEELKRFSEERENVYKEIVNLELEIKFLERKQEEIKNQKNISEVVEDIKNYFINREEFHAFEGNRNILWQNIFELYNSQNYSELNSELQKANSEEKDFFIKLKNETQVEEFPNSPIQNFSNEIKNLEDKLFEKKNSLEILDTRKNEISTRREEKVKELNNLEKEANENTYKLDNKILQFKLDLEKLYSQKENIRMKEESLNTQEQNFETLIQEMSSLIGNKVFDYKNFNENNIPPEEKELFDLSQIDLGRKLERSRIRIEESGVINAKDILDEYNHLSERDSFLAGEIEDLENSQNNLEALIKELKDTLLSDFNIGLQKINANFNNYFNEIFPGGKASLSLEKISKPIVEGINLEEAEEVKEPGIEISINLPEKKIKDLQMLSGGERALSSIALIFAMSSINHPPFMVLDETDAALDESNARKYGKMVRRLAEKSKLLVITHNRETMNQCDVLYGVTIGSEGSSKLLSIKFDQATEYAK
ncbi:Chromosome partition protein Smc [bioreactor metagenome]|uniref:Chromosome partition protein Smc n=1 Tax=bioreactor metagenome TaxID=1076179 RepID=A0A644T5L1_9ZZZZ|nr:AAA family ATPase [Candidatus Elulimicrobiales bacterium]